MIVTKKITVWIYLKNGKERIIDEIITEVEEGKTGFSLDYITEDTDTFVYFNKNIVAKDMIERIYFDGNWKTL